MTTGARYISGIMIVSKPRKGFAGYWTTENGRAVLRKKADKTKRALWRLYVDGQHVGTDYPNLSAMIHANEWAIRKAL